MLHARLALRLRLQLFGMELLRVMVRTFGDAGSAWVDAAVWSSDCVVFVCGREHVPHMHACMRLCKLQMHAHIGRYMHIRQHAHAHISEAQVERQPCRCV